MTTDTSAVDETAVDPRKQEKTCMDCKSTWVPSFSRDFYQVGDDPEIGRCESCMMRKAFEPKPIPGEEHLKKVCYAGLGTGSEKTCSFLSGSAVDGKPGFVCLRGSSLNNIIVARRNEGSMGAMGINCSGPGDFIPVTELK